MFKKGGAEADLGLQLPDPQNIEDASARGLRMALRLTEMGWHVFPARGKRSMKSAAYSDGKKWGATNDPAEVEMDFKRRPDANVGIACGPLSGLFVVEADTLDGHSVDGIANLERLIEENGPIPDTIEALSPSGSRHIYFRWPGGVKNSASKVAKGVDVRGDGGIIICPPSRTEKGDYVWVKPPGEYELAECPDWLLSLCRATPLLSAPKGQRNDTLNKLAFEAGKHRADPAQLAADARAIGLPDAEITATIKSGYEAGVNSRPDHLQLAQNALAKIGYENIICVNEELWLWRGGCWKKQSDRLVKRAIQDNLSVRVTANLVKGVTDVLMTEIFQPEFVFNRGPCDAVNCLNGEYVIGEGLQPHKRENYRTVQIPVAYDAGATAPRFNQFLDEVFRDDPDRVEKQQAILELMGYTLMSHARHERFVMLIGAGANGKSVLLSVLEALLGAENIAGVQPSNFDNRFQRATLSMKLANIVTELKQGEIIADAELKAITSGEPATVENKGKDPFVIRPFATCWFGTNHMPHTRDFSDALFRRATIISFNRVFDEDERDPHLISRLRDELPGILNLCLDAYTAATKHGFTQPQSSNEAKAEWRLEADQVAQWVQECTKDQDAMMLIGDAYMAYRFWAENNGIRQVMAKRGFSERLTRLGYGSFRKKDGRYVVGLRG